VINMYKRILVPIDGSPTAKRGLDEAIRLARHHGARLCLVHVTGLFIVTPLLGRGDYVGDIMDYLRDSGSRLLEQAARLVRKRGVAAETVMLEFDGSHAADAIVQHAKKWRANLIVMGTHGRRGISRLALGSDADLVARTSPVPVLLVKARSAR
jgi:nucleotide-binding universal stress UspA family protein